MGWRMYLLFLPWIVLLPARGAVQSVTGTCNSWHPPYVCAADLVADWQRGDGVRNDCFLVLYGGDYVLANKGRQADLDVLLEYVPEIELDCLEVDTFVREYGATKFADAYFMLHALKQGAAFDEARDGITVSTQFAMRPLNRYDFAKLEAVLSSGNALLQTAYLEKMEFLFGHYGCTPEIAALEPVILEYCPDSPLREKIFGLYRQYEKISVNRQAPLPAFYDIAGNRVGLEMLRGKIVVIDVWATWCCACMEKMPVFLGLQKKFAGRQDVVFLAVSIDTGQKHALWQKTVKARGMESVVNWIASPDNSSFCRDYAIGGVPRYIVIGKQGQILDAYASIEKIEQWCK